MNDLPNKRAGARAISVPADSSRVEGVEDLLKQVKETTDHVDILFANAGATWGEKFDTHPDKAFGKVMDLNVKSVFNTIRLWVILSAQCGRGREWLSISPNRFAPLLQQNATAENPSRVIVTASVAGLQVGSLGDHATFGYSASKGLSSGPCRGV